MNIHMPNANLLLPAAELGDADQITARILDEAPLGADPKSVRDVAVRHLLALKSDVNMRLAAAYLASPLVARPLLSLDAPKAFKAPDRARSARSYCPMLA